MWYATNFKDKCNRFFHIWEEWALYKISMIIMILLFLRQVSKEIVMFCVITKGKKNKWLVHNCLKKKYSDAQNMFLFSENVVSYFMIQISSGRLLLYPRDMPICGAFIIFYNSWTSSIVISHGKFADSHMRERLKEICNQFAMLAAPGNFP